MRSPRDERLKRDRYRNVRRQAEEDVSAWRRVQRIEEAAVIETLAVLHKQQTFSQFFEKCCQKRPQKREGVDEMAVDAIAGIQQWRDSTRENG